MSDKLITSQVWDTITETARRSKKRSYVAVAYFGKDAANLLPLRPGSRLVVNASESVVKSGQTHPNDLQRMRQRRVAIYSSPNLHAKVFLFNRIAFVGSTNVSNNSANNLQEAVLRTTNPIVRSAARKFINSMCLEPLGPSELKRLQKLYRPPLFITGESKKGNPKRQLSILRVARTTEVGVSDKLERAFDEGRKKALKKRKHNSGFEVDEFYWPAPSPFREGQLVIEVCKNAHGRIVSPPGRVIHTRPYEDGKIRRSLVFVEFPDQDWMPYSRFDKDAKRILGRDGAKNEQASRQILTSLGKFADGA